MAAVLLDATVLVDLLRGRPPAVERLRALRAAGDTAHTCAIVVDEIVRGLRPGEEERALRLLQGLQEVPLGTREGQRSGAWRHDFARRGVTLSQADCLIAAAAVTARARLATANVKDFPMDELVVEDWS